MFRRRKQRPPAGDGGVGNRALEPILVDYFTRDGSTLMMRLLSTAPQIAIGGGYPYEHKYFAYLYRWARLLDREQWPKKAWSGQHLASLAQEENAWFLGPPPWIPRRLLEPARGDEEISAYAFSVIWAEFSRRAVARNGRRANADVRYYAEKHMTTWEVDLDHVPPVRLIALLRDPRDTYVSIAAFRRMRREAGRAGPAMGRRPGEAHEDWLDRHLQRQKQRLRWIGQALKKGTMPVFRYEDLVLDLPTQARRLEEWLEVDLDPDAVAKDEKMRSTHVSAGTPESSIGRWREEMPADLATRFNRELGDELKALGFEVPRPTPPRHEPAEITERPAQSV